MAASPSSLAAAKIYRVTLWIDPPGGRGVNTANMVKVADVDVPWPLPGLIQYQGNYYVYSSWISSAYVQTVPYVPQPDLGAPPMSVVAFPEF
jgi:hypothetical protein